MMRRNTGPMQVISANKVLSRYTTTCILTKIKARNKILYYLDFSYQN